MGTEDPASTPAPPCKHRDHWAAEALIFGDSGAFLEVAAADVVCTHPGCGWAGRLAWADITSGPREPAGGVIHRCPPIGSLTLPCCGQDVTGMTAALQVT